jgi:hypothetical protein
VCVHRRWLACSLGTVRPSSPLCLRAPPRKPLPSPLPCNPVSRRCTLVASASAISTGKATCQVVGVQSTARAFPMCAPSRHMSRPPPPPPPLHTTTPSGLSDTPPHSAPPSPPSPPLWSPGPCTTATACVWTMASRSGRACGRARSSRTSCGAGPWCRWTPRR